MTIKEIAEIAGVSPGTVSKVINNKDVQLSEATRKKVLDVIKEYNYKPYANIRTGSSSFCLGVCISMECSSLLHGIMTEAQKHSYTVIILFSYGNHIQEQKNLSSLISRGIDGLIWEPVDQNPEYIKETESRISIPVQKISQNAMPSSWYIDYQKLGHTLTETLIKKKHTEIACLIRRDNMRSQSVLEGFRQCLLKNEISWNDGRVLYTDELDTDFSYMRNFTSIVSSHYDSALRLYKIAAGSHYSIPGDLSLVSLRDDTGDSFSYPAISGLLIPYHQFGENVCRNIIKMCETNSHAKSGAYKGFCSFTDFSSVEIPFSLQSPTILSIGAVNIDHNIISSHLPVSGETLMATSALETIGGKGANQAVGAARLKMKVSLIAKLGDDADADKILDFLTKEGVDSRGVFKEKGTMTGKAYIQLETGGNSTITVLSGANSLLTGKDIRRSSHLFKNAGFAMISTEIGIEAVQTAYEMAGQYGVKTILKPASVQKLPQELWKNTDYFVPNESEAALLSADAKLMTVAEQAAYFKSLGAKNVIITLGPKGCYLLTRDFAGTLPACNDFRAVDNTGAADAFISAFTVYLARGATIYNAVTIAQIAAAFSISHVGITGSLIDRVSLENYLAIETPDLIPAH